MTAVSDIVSGGGPSSAPGDQPPIEGGWLRRLTGGQATFPLVLLFAISLCEVVDRSAGQLLAPEMRDAFGLSNAGIGAITGFALAAGLALTIPIAYFADRHNRTRLMLLGAAAFTLFSMGTGLVGLVSTSWFLLLCMRSGTAIGQATIFPTHNSLLADYYDIPFRARVFSFHAAAQGIGLFLGPIVAGVIATRYGWEAAFLVLPVPCIILVLIGVRLREPARGYWERRAMGASDEILALQEAPPSMEEAWRMVWRIDSLRRIYYAVPFLAVAFIGFTFLASLFYENEFGLDAAARGLIEGIAEPFQLVGLLLSGIYGTRMLRRGPAFVLRFVSWVSAFAALMVVGFALSPNEAITVVFRVGIAIPLAALLPTVFAALSLAIPARARASGFSIAVIFVLPGLFVLPLTGWIMTNWGARWGMGLMAPVLLVGGIIISSAHKYIDKDIQNVWTSTAARAELLHQREQGQLKQLLVRDLEVRYGDVQILFGIDFEVEEGQIVALLGTNGAGKSTLLKALTGVVPPASGAVIFDGRDITDAPPHEIAALGVAMVPGGQGVFPSLTVRENLRVASWLEKDKARAAARVAIVEEMFPILRSRADDPAANLSGGQQQMLALSMAFLSEPKLLLIDELSLGLAPVIVDQLLTIVRAIREQGTTIILVEQSVNVALTVADTAYFMEKGEIRFHGPTKDLLDRPDVLRSVFLEGASKGLAGTDLGPDETDGSTNGSRHDGMNGHGSSAPDGGGGVVPTAASDRHRRPAPVRAGADGLTVQGLSVRFGGIRAVDDVSLSVQPGEIVGLIGPNGAGKTTLFDLISGFTSSDSGRVILDGRDVSRLTPDARARRGLGRSFQDARLFPALTVEDTIAVALERWIDVRDPFNAALRMPAQQDAEFEVRRRVDELVELLGIESFRSKFVRELSTGSRRVVDLACVLAHRPSVVLLDEPSSGIAQREAEALQPLLLRLRDSLGASMLIIEHDMPLITSVSDRLIALDQGRVVTEGRPDAVLAHPEVIASYLGTTGEAVARSSAT